LATATQNQALPEIATLQVRHTSNVRRFWRSFSRNKVALLGLIIVTLMSFGALFAPIIAPHDPIDQNITGARLRPPDAEYPLGADELGRDLFSRLLYGARVSLVIGLVGETVSIAIAMLLGSLAGWYGGWVDDVIMRIADIFFAIPGLMFLIVIVSIVEPNPITIFTALGLIGWPGEARMMRSQVLALKNLEYITSAKAIGATNRRIILQHIVPNALAPMIVLATLGVAGIILSESSLSFLGLGVQIPFPSWGTMVFNGQNYIFNAWWYAIFPGLAIMIAVLGFNFLGDGLRDALDPTQYR